MIETSLHHVTTRSRRPEVILGWKIGRVGEMVRPHLHPGDAAHVALQRRQHRADDAVAQERLPRGDGPARELTEEQQQLCFF